MDVDRSSGIVATSSFTDRTERMQRLLVILVNYRRADDTMECLASLMKSTFDGFDVMVVDNGSRDGSVEKIRTRFPAVAVIAHPENLGFVGGNNTGLRRALSEGYSSALLLNNDTVVDPGMLRALAATADERADAGIVGGKIYYADAPDRLWFAGGVLNRRSGAVSHRGMHERDTGRYDAVLPCDFVTGCCMLIRRDVLQQVGLLGEEYFAYYEDCDYALRARAAGFRAYYQPAARLWHKVSSTAQWDSPVYHYFTSRNRLLLLRKHGSVGGVLAGIPGLVFAYARQCARLAFKVRSASCLRGAMMGMVDGLRGYSGDHGKGRRDVLPASHGGQP
jgi:hypothetical protein